MTTTVRGPVPFFVPFVAALVTCLLVAAGTRAADFQTELHRFQRAEPHMGTTFGIVFYAPDESTANRAFETAFARIAALNRVCSDYDPESELSQLSAQSPTKMPVRVSEDLFRVLRASLDMSQRTEGAFDVTVGTVTRLWRRARLQKQWPDPARLKEALSSVGYRHLVLDPAARTVELRAPGMRLDLGAIAKGDAVDQALQSLRGLGITRALVNAGGNMVVGDPPPGESGWRIDIAPLEAGGEPTEHLWVANSGVSTSGDAFQFFEYGGKRYSHVLDPKTGIGLALRSSVTVAAPTGMLADALSTAVSVLGPDRGLKLIESTPEAAAFMVVIEDNKPVTYQSRGFARLMSNPN